MKISALFLIGLFSCTICLAQIDTTPPFKKFPVIPPLTLLKSDSVWVTKKSLKNLPTIIMYFGPKCDHCIHQFNDMVKRMKDLKKFQIIMATNQPMEELIAFEKKYKLHQYANIISARDTKFLLPPFFRMSNLPYFALYDKKGHLITTFDGNVKVDKLIQAFK